MQLLELLTSSEWTTVVLWILQVVGCATILVKGLERMIAPLEALALKTESRADDEAVAAYAKWVRKASNVLDLVKRFVGIFALQNPRRR